MAAPFVGVRADLYGAMLRERC